MFYSYHQNNSGGWFTLPAIDVIIEADSAEEADRIAESKGLYFDGAGDCDCCGNRWHETYDEGEEFIPELSSYHGHYSKRAEQDNTKARVIYYKNGVEA